MKEEKFFDRNLHLDNLKKRVSGLFEGYRQNIAVIGDELVGKTSLIFKFLSNFYDNRIITLYIEVRPQSLDSFAKRFIGVLLYNFLINSGLSLKEDLDFLISRSEKYAPRTVEKIKEILIAVGKRKKKNVFTELLSLCDLINQETGKFCVVILDEFQNLENLGIRNLYRDWAKLLIAKKNTMYIIISSRRFKTREILSKSLSLLFGNFEVINIEPFDIKVSERYLDYRLGTLNLNPALRNFIVHFTGGFPLYLEVISDALLKHSGDNLADTLENLLFDSSGALNQKFSNYIKRFSDSNYSKDYLSILYLIASGRNKIKDIAHILRKTKKELSLRVNRLLELDTVTRNADFLKINDRVFGFWLKFVYQGKLQSLTFDAKSQKAKFRDYIEEMIQDFLSSARKPIMQRMEELLRLFGDETVQLERKKIRLKSFREIRPLEFSDTKLKDGIIGRSGESLWIMAVKPQHLNEEDITAFAKECQKYRKNPQRKIILTLGDIDANTRLRALEEKIWTWDLSNLNQILDLYSKPWVIA